LGLASETLGVPDFDSFNSPSLIINWSFVFGRRGTKKSSYLGRTPLQKGQGNERPCVDSCDYHNPYVTVNSYEKQYLSACDLWGMCDYYGCGCTEVQWLCLADINNGCML
jgi:hypothetical protein